MDEPLAKTPRYVPTRHEPHGEGKVTDRTTTRRGMRELIVIPDHLYRTVV